jgi:hypothetical protein
MDHYTMGGDKASDTAGYPNKNTADPKQYQTKKVGGESHTRLYDSARSKIAVSKGKDKIPEADTMKANATNLETEDAIPAANYEPSDSSDDFQLQVNKVLGDDACSSQINRIGLVRCEYSVSSDIPQHFKTNNNVPLGSNIKITELDTDNAISYSGSLTKKNNSRPEMFDVIQISNPCAELKEAREK